MIISRIYNATYYGLYLFITMCPINPTNTRSNPVKSHVLVEIPINLVEANTTTPAKIKITPVYFINSFMLFVYSKVKLKQIKQ